MAQIEKIEKEKIKWHSQTVDYAFKKTNSNESGLSQVDADERLIKYGENSLPQKKQKSFFIMLLKEFINPIVLILLVAMTFSFIVGELVDGFVILGIILADAIIGAVQEKKAEKIANSLSQMIKVKAKVLRDGQKQEVDSKNLVVGDIVFLESGDKISADMRIIESSNFTVDEALLTGESINATKNVDAVKSDALLGDRTCMVFSGSSVITGRAKCLVVETGINTEIGKISTNLNNVEDQKSPLGIRLAKFSKQISAAIISVSVILFVVMLLQGNPFKDILLVVIALAVSAMPEGLPLAVTMALTVASNRMGKKNVVVKHLNAVESLGSCTVIATDKTGTLTLNEQTAKIVTLPEGSEFNVSGSGYNDDGKIECDDKKYFDAISRLALMGNINNESQLRKKKDKFSYFGDSIDIAFKVLWLKTKIKNHDCNILSQIPYESENKYSGVFFEENNKHYCTVKGSLEKILNFSSTMKVDGKLVEIDKDAIEKQNESLAKRGYRVIALAEGPVHKKQHYCESDIQNLTFIGLVGFIDPVRPETKGSIEECHKAGIKVIMITGDHPLTALSIAKDINIACDKSQVATGGEVEKMYEAGEEEFDKFVKQKSVFSRVSPTDKLHIVESLKRQGEFVAVTGDGVNDSPAIKSAHIGIAMGSGTDVSKETADMIIMDDNFTSIVEGVKEGRCAYANIRKITYFLLSCSIAEVLFFVLAMFCGVSIPLLPIQLLWLNLVTDGLQDMALSLEKPELNIMNEKPRSTKESLFTKSMVSQCLIMGGVIGLFVFGTWFILINVLHTDIVVARSLVMALMVFLQNLHAINCRSEKMSIFKLSISSNWFFVASIAISIGLQILFMEIEPLSVLLSLETVPYGTLFAMVGISLVIILICELYKLIIRKIDKKKLINSNQQKLPFSTNGNFFMQTNI
ncbi:MAG: HAD-IC family P-type ATPase [Clostridia bacterium]|nr:HAD-IC family P-type ATPase [Clostridia bacterium]